MLTSIAPQPPARGPILVDALSPVSLLNVNLSLDVHGFQIIYLLVRMKIFLISTTAREISSGLIFDLHQFGKQKVKRQNARKAPNA